MPARLSTLKRQYALKAMRDQTDKTSSIESCSAIDSEIAKLSHLLRRWRWALLDLVVGCAAAGIARGNLQHWQRSTVLDQLLRQTTHLANANLAATPAMLLLL